MGKIFNLDSPVMSALSKFADLIYLNFLTLICCLPIFTIGASITAMHYVLLKMVRDEDGYITRSFFKSFKQNFKQATIIWLIMLLFIVIFVGDILIFSYSGLVFSPVLKAILFAIAILVMICTMYTFPVLARFDNSVKNTFKNAMIMSVLALPKTLTMIVCNILPIALLYFWGASAPIVAMLGISGPAFLCAMLYNGTFKKYEPAMEETSPDDWTVGGAEEEKAAEIEENVQE